jgi:hypothetical protein
MPATNPVTIVVPALDIVDLLTNPAPEGGGNAAPLSRRMD